MLNIIKFLRKNINKNNSNKKFFVYTNNPINNNNFYNYNHKRNIVESDLDLKLFNKKFEKYKKKNSNNNDVNMKVKVKIKLNK